MSDFHWALTVMACEAVVYVQVEVANELLATRNKSIRVVYGFDPIYDMVVSWANAATATGLLG